MSAAPLTTVHLTAIKPRRAATTDSPGSLLSLPRPVLHRATSSSFPPIGSGKPGTVPTKLPYHQINSARQRVSRKADALSPTGNGALKPVSINSCFEISCSGRELPQTFSVLLAGVFSIELLEELHGFRSLEKGKYTVHQQKTNQNKQEMGIRTSLQSQKSGAQVIKQSIPKYVENNREIWGNHHGLHRADTLTLTALLLFSVFCLPSLSRRAVTPSGKAWKVPLRGASSTPSTEPTQARSGCPCSAVTP